MLDAALIKDCADPSLSPAIVRQFVDAGGSLDPLAITVTYGGRLVLVPRPATPDEATAIVRKYLGQAVVRIGLTQLPAYVAVTRLQSTAPSLVSSCENLKIGTGMFAKILRIVTRFYGNAQGHEAASQIFDDAIKAWKTGEFEGRDIFQAEDPKETGFDQSAAPKREIDPNHGELLPATRAGSVGQQPIGDASMRVDLSRIGGTDALRHADE